MMLSAYALHAADEKEKEEALPMERIESLQHLMNVTQPVLDRDYGDYKIYRSKVIAFITSSYLNKGTFTLNQDDPTAVSFGIVEYWQREYVRNLALRIFLKMNAHARHVDLAHVYSLESESLTWKQCDEESIARSDLKVRWATQDETIQLKQAMLNGKAKLDYDLGPDKEIALSRL